MANKHFPTGLDNRMRDHDGEIRKKRSDTKIETLREPMVPTSPRATVRTLPSAPC
jgi:hypothetical protein